MGLDVVRAPKLVHRLIAHAFRSGHTAGRPLRSPLRRPRGFADDLRLHLFADAGLAPRAPRFAQAGDAARLEATLPLAHHRAPDTHQQGGFLLAEPLHAVQNHAAAPNHPLARRRLLYQITKLFFLLRVYGKTGDWSGH